MEQFASCGITPPVFQPGERVRLTKLTEKGG